MRMDLPKTCVIIKRSAVIIKQSGSNSPLNEPSKKPLKHKTLKMVGIVAAYSIFAGFENGFLNKNLISFQSTINTASSVAR